MSLGYADRMRGIRGLGAVLCLLASFAFAGCGESDCEKLGNTLCEMACACSSTDECRIAQGGWTLSFDNGSDCKSFWVGLGCMGGGDDSVDYAACLSLVENAQCVDTGGGEMAIEFPDDAVCESSN